MENQLLFMHFQHCFQRTAEDFVRCPHPDAQCHPACPSCQRGQPCQAADAHLQAPAGTSVFPKEQDAGSKESSHHCSGDQRSANELPAAADSLDAQDKQFNFLFPQFLFSKKPLLNCTPGGCCEFELI